MTFNLNILPNASLPKPWASHLVGTVLFKCIHFVLLSTSNSFSPKTFPLSSLHILIEATQKPGLSPWRRPGPRTDRGLRPPKYPPPPTPGPEQGARTGSPLWEGSERYHSEEIGARLQSLPRGRCGNLRNIKQTGNLPCDDTGIPRIQ